MLMHVALALCTNTTHRHTEPHNFQQYPSTGSSLGAFRRGLHSLAILVLRVVSVSRDRRTQNVDTFENSGVIWADFGALAGDGGAGSGGWVHAQHGRRCGDPPSGVRGHPVFWKRHRRRAGLFSLLFPFVLHRLRVRRGHLRHSPIAPPARALLRRDTTAQPEGVLRYLRLGVVFWGRRQILGLPLNFELTYVCSPCGPFL